jgi:hypothetical protein
MESIIGVGFLHSHAISILIEVVRKKRLKALSSEDIYFLLPERVSWTDWAALPMVS